MKRAFWITGALIGTLTIGVAVAQQGPGGPRQGGPGRGPGHEGRPPMPPAPLFAALDTNHDGEISADEIAAASTALLTLDKNSDGKITRDELHPTPPNPPQGDPLRQGGPGPRPGPGGPPRDGRMGPGGPGPMRLMDLDADGDGFVTLDEFVAPAKEHFAAIDTSGDGKIDQTEAMAVHPRRDAGRPEPKADGEPMNGARRVEGVKGGR